MSTRSRSAVFTPIKRGSPAFRRVCAALFLSGLSNFALLYCVQPLMPLFAMTFHVSPAEASLALSLSTATMALSTLAVGSLADMLGRKPVIVLALGSSALLTLLGTLAPAWHLLLASRALMGLTLSGVPAIAMTYVSEEVDPSAGGLAMGLYIAGSAFGGMLGRLGAGILADMLSWQVALAAIGAVGLVVAFGTTWLLPPSKRFSARTVSVLELAKRYKQPFRDPALPWLFGGGIMLMGAFVTVYNYANFRLIGPPYNLSQETTALIFTLYLLGMVSSTVIGDLAGRLGRRKVFWAPILFMLCGILLTLAHPVWVIAVGIGALTVGFFGAHSIASSWVGRRAGRYGAQASSLYICSFYIGSSVAGSSGGLVWSRFGWTGVVSLTAIMVGIALLAAIRLSWVPPLPLPEAKGTTASGRTSV